jgi:putative ABC transport system permease protein
MPILRLGQLLRLAARNFWRFRLQAALITVAAMTGASGIIVSTGYAAGGRQKILDQFSRLGTHVIVVTPQQSKAVGGRARTGAMVTTLNAADLKAIRQSVEDITSFSPTVASVLRLRAGDLTKKTTVVGCDPDYFVIKAWPAAMGTVFDERAARQQARVALLGWTAARDLFGSSDPTGSHITINQVPFSVAGVLAERGQGLDASNEDDQVYVPLDTAMHRLMNINYFNAILFDIEDWSRMNSSAAEINQLLAVRHGRAMSAENDFLVQNRKSLIDTQLAAFARLTFLVKWIAASALFVSSLGVFAVTWIGIRNRTREIGTRRAIGATRPDILIQFFAEGTLGALIGGVTGIVVGNIALRVIDVRLSQPFVFSALTSFVEVMVSMIIYSTFTFISSLRAIRIQPLVALRAE